jgi:hypothetical protein
MLLLTGPSGVREPRVYKDRPTHQHPDKSGFTYSASDNFQLTTNMDNSSSTSASPPAVDLSPYVTIQPPLSRCGHGPGLLLIRPHCYATCQEQNKSLDPEPLKKWAEESFTVAQVTLDDKSTSDKSALRELILKAEQGLAERPECDTKEKVGLIGMKLSEPLFHDMY